MENKVNILREMGFTRAEAEMALQENPNNMDEAVEKLLTGQHKPPPYTPQSHQNQYNNVAIPGPPPHCSNQAPYNTRTNHTQNLYAPAVSQMNAMTSVDNTTQSTNKQHQEHSLMSTLFHFNLKKKNKPFVEDKSSAPEFFDLMGEEDDGRSKCAFNSLPPPYEKVLKEDSLKKWELEENVERIDIHRITDTKLLSQITEERCSSCFNSLVDSDTFVVRKFAKFYHNACFRKKFGPKCQYCCLLLDEPNKDHYHELSGLFLVYKNKNYHIECYEKYAGPRCTYCFNVIIERPNGEYSGNWVVDGEKDYHVECYQRKMYAIWKAKNS